MPECDCQNGGYVLGIRIVYRRTVLKLAAIEARINQEL